MTPTWTYEFSTRAQRSMKRLTMNDRRRVLDALDTLISDPLSGDIRKMRGDTDQWRLRVGSLRVIFIPIWQDKVVLVRDVGDRSNIYRE